ncbi:MAG: ABC transporter permease [Chloroflexota bacterium]
MALEQLLTSAFLITWLAASIRLAGPVLLAALGETFDELTGVLNIGIEGTILLGAISSYLITYYAGNPWLGVFGAILVGLVFNLLLAWLYVDVRANQVVVGIIFNLLALGLSSYVFRAALGTRAGYDKVTMFESLHFPILSDLPFLGPVLFRHNILVYLTFALVFVSGFVLYRTRFGLNLRAVGEHPRAADTAGINVFRMRYIGVLLSGAAASMAGAYLILSQLGIFRDNIAAGRGYIALAIVIFGRWNPYKAAAAALVFGAADALQLSLQVFDFNVPSQVLLGLPYVLTIIAMSGILGKAVQPAALLLPYKKD